jgi:predicted ATPase
VLSVRGEHEYVVPPLEPPDPERLPGLLELGRFDAVRLFVERAAAADPRFEVTEANAAAVAEITARLDGLPLAIELAATRTRVLTPEQMLPRLTSRLSLLTSGVRTLPERQRTLRGAIAWSHDLLDETERRLFARLSVFSGGWTMESASAVCRPDEFGLDALDGLTALVEMSLLRRTDPEGGSPRFSMLETIREFAQEQLADAPEDHATTTRRHAEHFLDLAMEAEPHLTEGDEWLARCDLEHANIRAALRWAIEAGLAERAQDAAAALWRFWQQRGHLTEGRRWFDEVLGMPSGQGPSAARARALIGAGGISWWQQDRAATGRCYEEAVAIERTLGDPRRLAEAIYNLSFVVAGDDVDAAETLLEESLELFRRADDERGVAQVLTMLVIRDAKAGNWEAVVGSLEEGAAIWRRVGERLHLSFDLVWLSFAHGRLRHMDEAWAVGLEAMDLFRSADNATGVGIVFTDLAFLATWSGHHADAARLAGAADAVRSRVGAPPGGFAGILEDDPFAEAATHLDPAEADAAFAEGSALTVDEGVALARRVAGA